MRSVLARAIPPFLILFVGCDNKSADPCEGVPEKGACNGEGGFKWCEVNAEQGTTVKTQSCQSYESCQMVSAEAKCVVKADRCLPGSSKCDGTRLGTCNESGNWELAPCTSSTCREMALSAYCDPGIDTRSHSARLKYQAKDIDQKSLNRWSDLFEVNAAGVLVVSVRGNTIIDSTRTDKDGKFTVNIPADLQTGDALGFVAARPKTGSTGVGVSMAVVNPKLKEGANKVDGLARAGGGEFWSWMFDLPSTHTDSYLITDEKLSGAMRMFDWMSQLMDLAEGTYPSKPSQPLAVWMQPNVTWDCGACQWDEDNRVGAFVFARNIVAEMTAQNEEYWSRAVYAHEFGHYVMSVWGVSPGEGGTHCQGFSYPPGLAWSEGWATWYSSEARRSSGMGQIYYDKQNGAFFTSNIQTREFSGGKAWNRPKPEGGLLQLIVEDEVSAMMWTLSSSPLTATALYQALASGRMTTSPFGRGYLRMSWDVGGDGCSTANAKSSTVSAPMLADLFDAVMCAGASAAVLDAATEPTKYYPYPSNNPICK